MKIIKSTWFPFGKFQAINWFGVIYYKSDDLTESVINHENIHNAQAFDFCKWRIPAYLIYYIVYGLVWFIELLRPPYNKAYKDMCFEREASYNQYNRRYLQYRQPFAWLNKKYWKRKK